MNFCGIKENTKENTVWGGEVASHFGIAWCMVLWSTFASPWSRSSGSFLNILEPSPFSFRIFSNMRCCNRRNDASDNGNSAVGNGNAAGGGGGGGGGGGNGTTAEMSTRMTSVVTTFFRSKRGREAAFTEVDDTTLDQVRTYVQWQCSARSPVMQSKIDLQEQRAGIPFTRVTIMNDAVKLILIGGYQNWYQFRGKWDAFSRMEHSCMR